MCSALETESKIAGEIPTKLKFSIPKELRRERSGNGITISEVLKVTLLQLIIVAGHFGIEAYILRKPVESELL